MAYTALKYGDAKISPVIFRPNWFAAAVGIAATSASPRWPSFTFANGVAGVAYSEQFDLTPANPTATVALLSGSLPPGLSIVQVSGNAWKIAGTPGAISGRSQTFAFALRASNSIGYADGSFSITIFAATSGKAWAWSN